MCINFYIALKKSFVNQHEWLYFANEKQNECLNEGENLQLRQLHSNSLTLLMGPTIPRSQRFISKYQQEICRVLVTSLKLMENIGGGTISKVTNNKDFSLPPIFNYNDSHFRIWKIITSSSYIFSPTHQATNRRMRGLVLISLLELFLPELKIKFYFR